MSRSITMFQTAPYPTQNIATYNDDFRVVRVTVAARCALCKTKIGSKRYALRKDGYRLIDGRYVQSYDYVCEDCINECCSNDHLDIDSITTDSVQTMHACAVCGEIHTEDEMEPVTDTDEWICDGCCTDGSLYDRGYTYCDKCGEIVREDDAVTVHVNTYRRDSTVTWCEDCVDNYTTRCDDCGDYWADGSLYTVSYYDDCGEYHSEGNICPSCADHYSACEDCGDWIHDDYVSVTDDGTYYCPDCFDNHRHSDKLKPYGKTYATNFYKVSQDPYAAIGLYLGVELETEATRDGYPEDLAADICDGIGEDRVECKHDGSLENGCEIVTQPMTPAYHLGDTGIWSDVVRICHDHGATSHDNGDCGMHIHVSRSALSSDGDFSPTWCLDRLMSTHRAAWVKFARRSCGMSWCSIDEQEPDTATPARDKYDDWCKEYHGDRYRAVNLTNAATVEWRLCRGSLNLETIRASIEMITGLVLVCREYAKIGIDPDKKSWSEIVKDVRYELETHELPTDDLVSYLKRRGLMPETVTA